MAITVCDVEGNIIDMNYHSTEVNAKPGDKSLIGKNVLDCHPPVARAKVLELLREGKQNIYTIVRGDVKKIIFQTPWYDQGQFAGLIEFSFEIPFDMPNFVRQPKPQQQDPS